MEISFQVNKYVTRLRAWNAKEPIYLYLFDTNKLRSALFNPLFASVMLILTLIFGLFSAEVRNANNREIKRHVLRQKANVFSSNH